MNRIFVLLFAAIIFYASCNNESNTEASASDSASNASSGSADTVSSSTNSPSVTNASTDTSFKQAMDKMMQNMHTMKMTEDPDHDFATMMKVHHEGAIAMSNIEIAHGANAELKQVAQKMIDDSQKDISELNSFLTSHQPDSKSDYSKKAMDKMMSKSSAMDMDHGGDKDHEFAMMMAMHHQQGIEMARDYLKSATEEQTKKVASNSIKANTEDIKKLKKWQSDNKAG